MGTHEIGGATEGRSGRGGTHRWRVVALSALAALALALPAAGQQVLERYEAVIAEADRRNSSGAALTRIDQILAQDRANVHRFGIRQPGDGVDRYFAERANRASFSRLLAAGRLGAGVEAAIRSGDAPRVLVEVIGRGGRAEQVRVSLAGTAQAGSGLTGAGQPSGADTVGGAPVVAQASWGFAADAARAIGSADAMSPDGLAASLRCHVGEGAVDSHVAASAAPGVATLMLSPTLVPGGTDAAVSLSVDGVAHLSRTMPVAQPEGAPAAQILLASPFVDALRAGRRLEVETAGRRVEIALSGSSAALAALRDYCAQGAPDPTAIARPGFDCARAGTATERALCADPDLARLDEAVNASMARATARTDDVREVQRRWLALRDGCGADAACLSDAMTIRGSELDAIAAGTAPPRQMAAAPAGPRGPGAAATGALPGFGAADPATPLAAPLATFGAAPAAPSAAAGFAATGESPALAPIPATSNADAVRTATALWILGQRPSLVEGLARSFARNWTQAALPPAYPVFQGDSTSNEALASYLARLATVAAGQAPPPELVLDLDVRVDRGLDGAPRLSMPLMSNTPVRTDIAVFRTATLELPLFGRNQYIEILESRAFPLPLPDGIPDRVSQGDRLSLRLAGTLSGHQIAVPQGETQLSTRPAARATFEIQTAALLSNGVRLHAWERPEGAGELRPFDMDAIEGIASAFGGRVEDERLLVATVGRDARLGLSQANGHLSSGDNTSGAQAADLAMRLAALIRAAPDRPLGPELIEEVSRRLLTPLERALIFPPSYDAGAMNEIARARFLEEIEPRLRQLVLDRAPRTTVPVRTLGWVSIGEYDRRTQGFPLTGLNLDRFGWVPGASMRRLVEETPTLLAMPEDRAMALLERLAGNRQIVAQLDYAVAAPAISAVRGGPVTAADLSLVRLDRTVSTLSFFAGPDRTEPLMTVSLATEEPRTAGAPVPPEVLLTTGATLLAGADRLDGAPGALEERLGYRRDISTAPAGTREARIAEAAAEIRARTPDRFWIGAQLSLGAYDAAAGGLPVEDLSIRSVPHGADIDGIDPIGLQPADPADFALLPVSPDAAQTVEGLLHGRRTLEVLFDVALTGDLDTRRGRVQITRPARVLVGPRAPSGGISSVVIDIAYPEKRTLGVAENGPVSVAPEALFLTPEAADLIALSLAPGSLDDAMLARMMRERLALERAAEDGGVLAQWGRFFADPALPLTDAARTALAADFRAWTEGRVANLPATMILPLAEDARAHPQTGCSGLGQLDGSNGRIGLSAGFGALFGERAGALGAGGRLVALQSSDVPRPGGDTAFALVGRPTHEGLSPRIRCDGHARIGGGDTTGMPYADLAILARGMPVFGPLPDRFAAANVRLEDVSLRPVPLVRQPNDGAGLTGAVVVEGTVTGVEIWTAPSFRAEATQTVSLTPQDWNAALGQPPEATDIVGLTLEMPLADYLERVAERMPAARRYEGGSTGTLYGRGVALVDPESRETFVAVPATDAADAPLLAIGRSLWLPPAGVPRAALRGSLVEKYGDPAREMDDDQSAVLVWGVPDRSVDRRAICGGASKFRNGARPDFAPADAELPPLFWDWMGWPEESTRDDGSNALDRCGPVVTAQVRETDEATILSVWVHDEARARHLHEEATATPRPAPDIELDL